MRTPDRRFRIVSEETFSGKPKEIVYTEGDVRRGLGRRFTMLKAIPADQIVGFLRARGLDIEEVGQEEA